MSDEMRSAYAKAGALQYFFESTVPPINLWRGRKKDEHEKRHKAAQTSGRAVPATFARDLSVEPITEGFEIVTRNGRRWREPDVEVFFKNGQPWIRGCRTLRHGGAHWGISLWSQKPSFAERGWFNFCLPGKDAKPPIPIPPSLAITQDDDFKNQSNHFSIAPKDDMPLALFVQHLKELAEHLIDWIDL